MPSFFLVRTQAGCEERVQRRLTAQSFDVQFLKTRSLKRGKLVEQPLFARTLLIADDGRGLGLIRSSPGVTNVAMRDGRPVRLSQALVNRLLKHEDNDGFVVLQFDVPLLRRMDGETRATIFTAHCVQPETLGQAI